MRHASMCTISRCCPNGTRDLIINYKISFYFRVFMWLCIETFVRCSILAQGGLEKCVRGVVPTMPHRKTVCMKLILHTSFSQCMLSHDILLMCACTSVLELHMHAFFLCMHVHTTLSGATYSRVCPNGFLSSKCMHTHKDL